MKEPDRGDGGRQNPDDEKTPPEINLEVAEGPKREKRTWPGTY